MTAFAVPRPRVLAVPDLVMRSQYLTDLMNHSYSSLTDWQSTRTYMVFILKKFPFYTYTDIATLSFCMPFNFRTFFNLIRIQSIALRPLISYHDVLNLVVNDLGIDLGI